MAESQSGIVGAQLKEGDVVAGRYQVSKTLGSGGMGSVYLAKDMVLANEEVAIKILHPEFARDDRQTQRFLREVQLMRRVNHKNVVRTYDVGSEGLLVYFTMEYVPGFSLSEIIKAKAFPQNQLANMIIQICEGLDAIHAAGIVHRDLKPGNIILLRDGTIKITDFGFARTEKSELTAHNEIIGSASYMAPEIWLGKKITYSVDLYSLGIVLYVLTTGRLPFDAEAAAALMRMHVDRAPLPPKELNKAIEPWLNKLILKLMAKSPAERPQSGRAVIDYIKDHLEPRRAKGGASTDGGDAYAISKPFINMLEERSQRAVEESAQALPAPKLKIFNLLSWAASGSYRALLFHRLFDRFRYSRRFLTIKNILGPALASLAITIVLFAGTYFGGSAALNSILTPFADPTFNAAAAGDPRLQSYTMVTLNGIPYALLFVLLCALPCAALCSMGSSVRTAIKAAGVAGFSFMIGGSCLIVWLLTPVLRHGTVTGLSIITAAFAAKQQLSAIALLSPVVGHFEFSVLERGMVQTGSEFASCFSAPLLSLATFFYVCLLSWLAGGAAGLKETRRLLFTGGAAAALMLVLFLSDSLIGAEATVQIPIFEVVLPTGAVLVSCSLFALLGAATLTASVKSSRRK